MDDLVDYHARAAARLETVRTQLAQACKDRDEVEETAKAVAELRTAFEQADDRAKSAGRDEQIARDSLDRRKQLVADTTVAQHAVTENRKMVTDLETAQSDKDSDFDRAQKALAEQQTALDHARAQVKTAAKTVTKARAQAELTELTRRLETIREHDEKKTRAQATIESIKVTTSDVGEAEFPRDRSADCRERENLRCLADRRETAGNPGCGALTALNSVLAAPANSPQSRTCKSRLRASLTYWCVQVPHQRNSTMP